MKVTQGLHNFLCKNEMKNQSISGRYDDKKNMRKYAKKTENFLPKKSIIGKSSQER